MIPHNRPELPATKCSANAPFQHQFGKLLYGEETTHWFFPIPKSINIVQWICSDHCEKGVEETPEDEAHFENREVKFRDSKEPHGNHVK